MNRCKNYLRNLDDVLGLVGGIVAKMIVLIVTIHSIFGGGGV
jgi:hypothetical protein